MNKDELETRARKAGQAAKDFNTKADETLDPILTRLAKSVYTALLVTTYTVGISLGSILLYKQFVGC